MNTSTASSPSGNTSPSPRSSTGRDHEDEPRPARAATPQQAEAFAKLLRRKAGDTDDDAKAPTAERLFPPPRPDSPQPRVAAEAPAAVQASAPSATAEAMRCAQVHGVHAAAPWAGTDPMLARWEVQLGDPLGGSLQVRATSSASIAAAAVPVTPTWELSLSASQIGAHTLARHAPRLSERLRARGVEHDGVLVQSRHPRHTPQDESGDELA
ncbi:hypothetical protein BurJ1DRAFT_2591 [Burkholderiales bacterium JOSHI_001]|nr:hypothetical protein BurJ1DRAFT_2591 [Burkholderiales bacterium JOSHI_001]